MAFYDAFWKSLALVIALLTGLKHWIKLFVLQMKFEIYVNSNLRPVTSWYYQ